MRSVQGVDRWQLGRRAEEAEPIKRAVKEAFHGLRRKLDGSVTDRAGVGSKGGTGRVARSSVWQTHRRTELGERPGTGSGDDSGGGILLEKWLASRSRPGHSSHRQRGEITQSDALRHTPVEERTGGRRWGGWGYGGREGPSWKAAVVSG